MTVAELIKLLEKEHPEAVVFVHDGLDPSDLAPAEIVEREAYGVVNIQ